MESIDIFQLGDQAATVSLSDVVDEDAHRRLMAMKRWIDDHAFPGLQDCIVSYGSLTLVYDVYTLKRNAGAIHAFQFVQEKLQQAYAHASSIKHIPRSRVIDIPVCYEEPFSPDLDLVCSRHMLDRRTVIDFHTSKTYRVYMIGFLPGFPYMAAVASQIAVPRKEKPRALVPAGSVGIAGMQTGIYPVDSPGGWQIIGKTPLTLFDKGAHPPVKIEPGDEVRFYPITREVFYQYSG